MEYARERAQEDSEEEKKRTASIKCRGRTKSEIPLLTWEGGELEEENVEVQRPG